MNPLFLINELAVLTVALLGLCVSTLWYSYFFKSLWKREVPGDEPVGSKLVKATVLTVAAYAVVLAFCEVALALLSDEYGPYMILTFIFIVCSAVQLPAYVWEKRSLAVYMLHISFLGMLVYGGGLLLMHWPW